MVSARLDRYSHDFDSDDTDDCSDSDTFNNYTSSPKYSWSKISGVIAETPYPLLLLSLW